MVFNIAPALPTDIPYLSTIQWAALLSNPLIQTLYPQGPTPDLTAFTRDSYNRAIQFPSVRLVKATDTERGEIVAFAKWIVYPEEDIDEWPGAQKTQRSGSWAHVGEPEKPKEVNEKALRAWNDIISRMRRGIMRNRRHECHAVGECTLECYFGCFAPRLWGKYQIQCLAWVPELIACMALTISAYPVLDIIHTHPSHQGRGAGTQLVKWGTDLADKQHLQCYLEASPAGYPLFRKADFEEVTEMEIDLNRYRAGRGVYKYKHIVMIRPPNVRPQVPPKDRMVTTPDSAMVGGWDFGLLDTSRFGTSAAGEEGEQRASSMTIGV